MKQIRILIADDHALIAEMWQMLLSANAGYTLLPFVQDCARLLAAVTDEKPDVVFLDISLSDGSSLDLLPELCKVSPQTKFLIVSSHTNMITVKKAFSSGAHGFISKTSTFPEIAEAINAIMEGKKFQCKEVQDLVAGYFLSTKPTESSTEQGSLTHKEREVAYLIYKGMSSRQIAEQLSVSAKTVEVHRHHVYQKLNINKSIQLFWYVQENIHLFTDVAG